MTVHHSTAAALLRKATALRATMTATDEWDLTDEGSFEEIRKGGALDLWDHDGGRDEWAATETRDLIADWESRA